MNAALSIAGVSPRQVLVPADRAELASMLRDLYASGKAYAVVGGGTELGLGNAPRALDTVVRMTALDRLIDYSPEDQTVTVEAGMRIAALDAHLARAGQLLPIDVGDRRNATIGGAIATNAYGARRHRYGSIKDFIVGIEIVRPDGVVAHGGGKVVKNVAGFDLPKLMVGSLGTLGAIASATFRVFPQPACTQSVRVAATPASPWFAACMADRSLDPVTVVHFRSSAEIVLTFAGPAASVEQQVAHSAALAAAHAMASERLDASAVARCAAIESAVRSDGTWRWRAQAQAPVVPAALAVAYPTFGVTFAGAADDAAIDDLIAARGTSVVFGTMPQRARGHVDAWGPPPPSFSLMRALKTNFDPRGLCNPGRFVGGL